MGFSVSKNGENEYGKAFRTEFACGEEEIL
jgi:hypothetical protein